MTQIINNILITGANGFVGRHLTKELADHGYSLFGLGGPDLPASFVSSFKQYTSLNLLDAKSLSELDFKNIDAVIHLAGIAAVGPSYDQPMKYIDTNMGIELNLFEAALSQKAFPKFLIISSGTLYSPNQKLPLNEESPIIPNSPYALSKLGQENLAQYYSTRGFDCIIARPFNHIGPGQGQGYIVPDLALQVVSAIKEGKQTIRVGNLAAKRDYTDVRDIARAYRLLLENGHIGETYNVSSGKAVSGEDILLGLMKAARVNLKPVVDPSKLRPLDNLEIYGSHDKITRDTGWSPQIDIHQTLVDVINSF